MCARCTPIIMKKVSIWMIYLQEVEEWVIDAFAFHFIPICNDFYLPPYFRLNLIIFPISDLKRAKSPPLGHELNSDFNLITTNFQIFTFIRIDHIRFQ